MIAPRHGLLAFLLVVFSLFLTSPAYAQLDIPNMNDSILIRMTPEHPAPGDTVHLTAQSVLLELSKMNITWTAGGRVIAQGIGVVEADAKAAALGSQTKIILDATSENNSASKQTTIIPTEIDLLFESDSYVPPFYEGRALPSENTSVRLQAVPRFKRADGTLIPANALIYTWKRNGSVVNTASGRGRFTATLPSPALFGTDTITLEAVTTDGIMSGSASVRISSVSPTLLLYEDHALFGVMYHKALTSETFTPVSEATLAAVPYFTHASSPNDTSLIYDWTVNNSHIVADTIKRSEITISSGKNTGHAQIHLDLTQEQNPYLNAFGEWGITFSAQGSSGSGGAVNNPFLPKQ